MAVNSVGTFCVVIHKQLVVKNCPIRTCTWRAENGQCRYSPQAESYTAQELAKLLDRPSPTDEPRIKADLFKAVKSAVSK
jgi:hypothetical protein